MRPSAYVTSCKFILKHVNPPGNTSCSISTCSLCVTTSKHTTSVNGFSRTNPTTRPLCGLRGFFKSGHKSAYFPRICGCTFCLAKQNHPEASLSKLGFCLEPDLTGSFVLWQEYSERERKARQIKVLLAKLRSTSWQETNTHNISIIRWLISTWDHPQAHPAT